MLGFKIASFSKDWINSAVTSPLNVFSFSRHVCDRCIFHTVCVRERERNREKVCVRASVSL
uniref:Uncharacterized protein n=1 Tax=Rhizophora mucronata TaxID=61149 RepID=A0A2P2MDJ3_RHIMU